MQQAEMLNQTLTTAYQELRAEITRLETEKAQEQYYASLQGQPDPSLDTSLGTPGSIMGAYGQGEDAWGDSTWIPEEWEPEDDHGQ